MFSIVVNGSQVTVNDFATMVKMLFSKLDEQSLRRFPRRVVPQPNWVACYLQGKSMIALPSQIRHFCFMHGVTQSGKMRLNAKPLQMADILEFFRSCDRFNRGLFGEKLLTDKSATRIVLPEFSRFDVLVNDERLGRGFNDFKEAAEAMFETYIKKTAQRLRAPKPWFAVMCYRLNGSYLILNYEDVKRFCRSRDLLGMFGGPTLRGFVKEPDLNNYCIDMDRLNRRDDFMSHRTYREVFKLLRAN